jgi:hypothetical protein
MGSEGSQSAALQFELGYKVHEVIVIELSHQEKNEGKMYGILCSKKVQRLGKLSQAKMTIGLYVPPPMSVNEIYVDVCM